MISKIGIKNFKAFGHFEEELSNLNLITGLNGMGKSTIIQALLLLRQSFQMQKLKEKGLFLNGDYVKIGKGIDAYWLHGEEEEIVFNLEWHNGTKLNSRFKYLAKEDVLPIIGFPENPSSIFETALFTDKFQYLHAERIGQQDMYPASEYEVSELKSLGVKGQYTTYFLEKNLSKPLPIKELLHENDKTDSLGSQINVWLSEISPGVSFIPESILDSELARQFYEFEYGGQKTRKFRSSNVGFGLNYILPVLTAVLYANKGDLIIIENPEAHIHPRGQSRLGWLFALAATHGVQLIIETHSDHILNGIRVAVKQIKEVQPEHISIFYFTRNIKEKSHITEVKRPKLNKNGRVDQWPEGFLDEWDNMLDKLI